MTDIHPALKALDAKLGARTEQPKRAGWLPRMEDRMPPHESDIKRKTEDR